MFLIREKYLRILKIYNIFAVEKNEMITVFGGIINYFIINISNQS